MYSLNKTADAPSLDLLETKPFHVSLHFGTRLLTYEQYALFAGSRTRPDCLVRRGPT